MPNRTLSHLLTHYGMAIVLLILCLYYSYATLQSRQLSGPRAVDDVAKQITKPNPTIVLVASVSSDDQQFTELLQNKIKLTHIVHDPPTARATISNQPPDFIIATDDTIKWLPNVLERIPAARNIPIITPGSSLWPTFLQKDNLLNIANQIV